MKTENQKLATAVKYVMFFILLWPLCYLNACLYTRATHSYLLFFILWAAITAIWAVLGSVIKHYISCRK